MTPCEKLGYKVGDEFEVVEEGGLMKAGGRLKLLEDDGSKCPEFECIDCVDEDGDRHTFTHLRCIKPLPITLRPGDYVSTEGLTDDEYHAVAAAFMAAGAEKGEYPNWGFVTKTSADSFGWLPGGDLYHQLPHEFERHLTINQVLNATNAPGKSTQQGTKAMSGKDGEKLGVKRTVTIDIAGLKAEPQQEPTPMTSIDTLHEAKRQRDEAAEKLKAAEAVLAVALDAVQADLGVGFIIKEAGDSDLAERTLGRLRRSDDIDDPANWRVGDVVRATEHSIDITEGREYVIAGTDRDGDIEIQDDAGDVKGRYSENFIFVRRP